MNLDGARPTSEMSREEFHKIRTTGIGGSDIAPILGISPFPNATAMNVWMVKRALIIPDDSQETKAMIWGRRHEASVIAAYQEATGNRVLGGQFKRHNKHDWAFGSCDGIVVVNAIPSYGLEAKTSRYSKGWGDEWTDQIPYHYITQCAWYMHVFDSPWWDVAVLIGGSEERYYRIHRNTKLETAIIEKVSDFWSLVQTGKEPSVDHSEAWGNYLAQLYPRDKTVEPIEGDEETSFFAEQLKAAKRKVAEAEREVDKFVNEIKKRIGDNAGVFGEGYKIWWKKNRDSTKIDHEEALREIVAKYNLPPAEISDIIGVHTTTKPGSRVFRPVFESEEE